MLLTPEKCRVARALLRWEVHQLAAAAGIAASAVERFEEGSMVEPASVEMMLEALQGTGLEFIPAGGKSLDGGPGLRTVPRMPPAHPGPSDALHDSSSFTRSVVSLHDPNSLVGFIREESFVGL